MKHGVLFFDHEHAVAQQDIGAGTWLGYPPSASSRTISSALFYRAHAVDHWLLHNGR